MVNAALTKVKRIIEENPVAVFSKSYCPYCKAAKETLSKAGATYYALELDQIDDGSELQNALQELTDQRTVPNIFIGQNHIGGNSDLQSKSKEGELKQLLAEAGAV